MSNNRIALPAIRSSNNTPNNNNNINGNNNSLVPFIPQQQQQDLLDNALIPRAPPSNVLNASLELSSTQQRVKQLESRIQLTEYSNRALLEEVVRLQNELALTLRKSLDSIQEERAARQQLETSYRFYYDNMIQMSGRIKRAEDVLQEDRSAVQSLVINTRNLEQAVLNTQKDLFARRDLQASRLDELRLQIDDMQRSKENLERSAFSLIDEIKALKSKVDVESMNLNSVGADLRNKTRRLEDENRQNMDALRKQQDSVSNTENSVYQVRSYLEGKIHEVTNSTNDLRTRLEREKEERRNLEQAFTLRISDFNTVINEDKIKFAEMLRLVDNLKREVHQNQEIERSRLNTALLEAKELIQSYANEKIEKIKDDIYGRIRDLERQNKEENEQRVKFQQNFRETTDLRIDGVKHLIEEEIQNYRDEMRDTSIKSGDSIRKLNEGLNLIEQQNDETRRHLEKVMSAEIKLRKQTDANFDERLQNYDEKFTYAMSSFQAALGSLGNKVVEQKETLVSRTDFDDLEKKHTRLEANVKHAEMDANGVKETLKSHQQIHESLNTKIKDMNESVYTIENVQLQSINTKLMQTATTDQLVTMKKEIEDQVQNDLKKNLKQNEENNVKSNTRFYENLTEVKLTINDVQDKMNQKILNSDNMLKEQILTEKENLTKSINAVREESRRVGKQVDEKYYKDNASTEEKLSQLKLQMNILDEKYNQRLLAIEKSAEEQVRQQNDANNEWKNSVNEDLGKAKIVAQNIPLEMKDIETRINTIKQEHKKLIETEIKTRNEEIEKLKQQIFKIERSLDNDKNHQNSNNNNN